MSAHKKKIKNEYDNNSEKMKMEIIHTHTHKRDSAFRDHFHTHTSVADNNIPAGKFNKSPTFTVPPQLWSITKHTRVRESKKKEAATHYSQRTKKKLV